MRSREIPPSIHLPPLCMVEGDRRHVTRLHSQESVGITDLTYEGSPPVLEA